MHRGGTSAVAGMLHRLGVDFGPRLMPANADNPAGYYEHNDVVNLHDRFLGRLGVAWDDPFPPPFDGDGWPGLAPGPGLPTYQEELLAILKRDFTGEADRSPAPPWGLKDPRLCLLLPWWAPLWSALDSEPRFILVLRSPEAVAASLRRRDGVSPVKSNLLWLQHLLRAERDTRGHRRCFVDYDEFLADWRATLARVSRSLDVTWPCDPASLPPAEAGFLDPTLRHHAPPRLDAREPQRAGLPWVETVRSALFPVDPGKTALLDAVHAELTRAQPVFAALNEGRGMDFSAQLQAQRRLTRWYEEEWQNALRVGDVARRRVEKQGTKIRSLQSRLEKPPSVP